MEHLHFFNDFYFNDIKKERTVGTAVTLGTFSEKVFLSETS